MNSLKYSSLGSALVKAEMPDLRKRAVRNSDLWDRKMSLIEELARSSHEAALASIFRICDLPDASTPLNSGANVRWGETHDNKLLARGLFLAGMCSAVETEGEEAGLLGWNGCLFGRYELEEACMVSPSDGDDHPAMESISSLEDVNHCVGDAVQEIKRLGSKTGCEVASNDAFRALAGIFHNRYGWSCNELGFRAEELLSSISLPEEAAKLIDDMKGTLRKNNQ